MSRPRDDSESLSLGVALIVTASLAIYFSNDIGRTGVTQEGGIGPRAFPLGLSFVLMAGGVCEMSRWFFALTFAIDGKSLRGLIDEFRSAMSDAGSFNVFLFVIMLAGYILLINLIGFTASSLFFAVIMMLRLGTSWWVSLATSVTLVICVKVLFYYLFKVQLPNGVLNAPF